MIRDHDALYGGDPEAFLEVNGEVVGSEHYVPENGSYLDAGCKLVRDGVQVEIQLSPEHGAPPMYYALRALKHDFLPEGVTFSMRECVEVSDQEMGRLSHKSRVLGCSPSLNIYTGPSVVDVPPYFRTRSAGGHVHIGLKPPIWGGGADERRSLIPILDWVVGNTCVMLNPGPDQATRRKVYGKAGEYRLPSHGVEYRTLSNFWLKGMALSEVVFSLTAFAVDVWHETLLSKGTLADQLMKDFSVDDVTKAINENDVALAKKNFELIAPFILEHGREEDSLNRDTLKSFYDNVDCLATMFDPTTTLERWCLSQPTLAEVLNDLV